MTANLVTRRSRCVFGSVVSICTLLVGCVESSGVNGRPTESPNTMGHEQLTAPEREQALVSPKEATKSLYIPKDFDELAKFFNIEEICDVPGFDRDLFYRREIDKFFARGVPYDDIGRSFRFYKDFAESIRQCSEVALYKGLPHPWGDKKWLEEQLKRPDVVILDDWPFYEQPVKLSDEDAQRLKALYCTWGSFSSFVGAKSCGGYHPDWCIKWSDAEREFFVSLCFGCNEMKTTDGTKHLYCDMNPTHFKPILEKYENSHRP